VVADGFTTGETTNATAKKFNVSAGRISLLQRAPEES